MSEKPQTERRYRVKPSPKCRVHGVLMRVSSHRGRVTYYECPVPGCEQRGKLLDAMKTLSDIRRAAGD